MSLACNPSSTAHINFIRETMQHHVLVLYLCDGISLMAHSQRELQHLLHRVHQTSNRSEMIISIFNTEVQCTGKDNQQIDIKFSCIALQQVEGFIYLEGTTCTDSTCDKDVTRRIA